LRDHALVLFSGLPGTGKTSLAQQVARQLAVPLFAKDRIQSALRVRGLADRETVDGYYLLFDLADEQLGLGISVVLDAVFPREGFRRLARDMASRHSAKFYPIHCYCSDEGIWLKRMKKRQQYVPNWTPVGWDEVKRIQTGYEPWEPEGVLFVDAISLFEENLARVLRWIRGAESD
jgi:predicted kinase